VIAPFHSTREEPLPLRALFEVEDFDRAAPDLATPLSSSLAARVLRVTFVAALPALVEGPAFAAGCAFEEAVDLVVRALRAMASSRSLVKIIGRAAA
jgi:hypothetical protein